MISWILIDSTYLDRKGYHRLFTRNYTMFNRSVSRGYSKEIIRTHDFITFQILLDIVLTWLLIEENPLQKIKNT